MGRQEEQPGRPGGHWIATSPSEPPGQLLEPPVQSVAKATRTVVNPHSHRATPGRKGPIIVESVHEFTADILDSPHLPSPELLAPPPHFTLAEEPSWRATPGSSSAYRAPIPQAIEIAALHRLGAFLFRGSHLQPTKDPPQLRLGISPKVLVPNLEVGRCRVLERHGSLHAPPPHPGGPDNPSGSPTPAPRPPCRDQRSHGVSWVSHDVQEPGLRENPVDPGGVDRVERALFHDDRRGWRAGGDLPQHPGGVQSAEVIELLVREESTEARAPLLGRGKSLALPVPLLAEVVEVVREDLRLGCRGH